MRCLGRPKGTLDFGGVEKACENVWLNFLSRTVRNIRPVFFPGLFHPQFPLDAITFQAEVLLQGLWLSVRPPTAAGCVVDVPNLFASQAKGKTEGEENISALSSSPELPCEIPVRFRDFDFLRTRELLSKTTDYLGVGMFRWLAGRYFSHLPQVQEAFLAWLGPQREVSDETFRKYLD
ncbi:MAG: hypothetical protein D6743_04280, partial [Calditrichaeota bacterium]